MVYSIAEVPAFREQILANLSFTHRAEGVSAAILKGGSSRHEIVTYVSENGSFVAAVVDITSGSIVLKGEAETDLGLAINRLFIASSEAVTKALESQLRQTNAPGAHGANQQ